jgi:hypothetical protein
MGELYFTFTPPTEVFQKYFYFLVVPLQLNSQKKCS